MYQCFQLFSLEMSWVKAVIYAHQCKLISTPYVSQAKEIKC